MDWERHCFACCYPRDAAAAQSAVTIILYFLETEAADSNEYPLYNPSAHHMINVLTQEREKGRFKPREHIKINCSK